MTLLTGNSVTRIMKDLKDCFVTQLEDPDNGVPRPCVVTLAPGETVTPEYQGDCEDSADPEQDYSCGLAWIRLLSAYPAAGVGEQDVSVGNCNSSLGFDLNIGITRCFDPGPALEGMSTEQMAEISNLTITDMLIMMKSIKCCTALTSKSYIIHGYTPIGPLGGMVGGAWTVSVVI